MSDTPRVISANTGTLGPSIIANVIGGSVTLVGAIAWYLTTIHRMNFDSPPWATWLHTATIITYVLLYLPIGFVLQYSTALAAVSIQRHLDTEDLPLDTYRKVKPHRVTRKIAQKNSKNLEKVKKRLPGGLASSGPRLTIEDLDDIVLDIARNPLRAILVDHLPRILFIKKDQLKDIRPWRKPSSHVLRLFGFVLFTIVLGELAWLMGLFVFYVAAITSATCLALTLAFWEHSRIRYVLTSSKLGLIEWRLFFASKRQVFVAVSTVTEIYTELSGFGQAFEKIHIGWGSVYFKTSENTEILDEIIDVSDPELVFAYVAAIHQQAIDKRDEE